MIKYACTTSSISGERSMVTSGAFHLLELTSQTIPVAMRTSFLINSPTRSVKLQNVCTKEMVFQQKLLEKADFMLLTDWSGRPILTNGKHPKWCYKERFDNQCAKKGVSDGPGLVDFAIGLANSFFYLTWWASEVFWGNIQITEQL